MIIKTDCRSQPAAVGRGAGPVATATHHPSHHFAVVRVAMATENCVTNTSAGRRRTNAPRTGTFFRFFFWFSSLSRIPVFEDETVEMSKRRKRYYLLQQSHAVQKNATRRPRVSVLEVSDRCLSQRQLDCLELK